MLDALPLTQLDITGIYEPNNPAQTLRVRGAELVVAGRMAETRDWFKARGLSEGGIVARHFPTLLQAVRAYRQCE